jgi:4'-phosphopantetheinyl transferase
MKGEPPCLVDVHVVGLDRVESQVGDLAKLLSGQERERAARLHRTAGLRYTVCRAALRLILAARVAEEPRSLELVSGPHGKPELPGGPSFGVAHSGECGLIAVSARAPALGVDVERMSPARSVSGVIRRFLSPSERQALARMDDRERLEAFYWCWTAKEAYLKALGTGLSVPLDRFDVSVDLRAPAELIADRGALSDDAWTLRRLYVADGYAATLAVAASECEVRCRRWAPPVPLAA